jgi:hypothetical protein
LDRTFVTRIGRADELFDGAAGAGVVDPHAPVGDDAVYEVSREAWATVIPVTV